MIKPPILQIKDSDNEYITCEGLIDKSYKNLNQEGKVPIWFGLEFITDTISLLGDELGESVGNFVGASKVEYLASSFSEGQRLEIKAELRQEKDGVKLYKGAVLDKSTGEPLVESLIKTVVTA